MVETNITEEDLSREFSPRSCKSFKEREPPDNTPQYILSKEFVADEKVYEFVAKLREKNQNYYRRNYKPKQRIKDENRINANEAITYQSLTYVCIFGKKEESKGQGVRKTSYVYLFIYLFIAFISERL